MRFFSAVEDLSKRLFLHFLFIFRCVLGQKRLHIGDLHLAEEVNHLHYEPEEPVNLTGPVEIKDAPMGEVSTMPPSTGLEEIPMLQAPSEPDSPSNSASRDGFRTHFGMI